MDGITGRPGSALGLRDRGVVVDWRDRERDGSLAARAIGVPHLVAEAVGEVLAAVVRVAVAAIGVEGQCTVGRTAHQAVGKRVARKITIGRDDLKLTEMGAPINARMGLNTWAAFVGTNENAAVAGDVAMLASEVTPVLKTLRSNGLDVQKPDLPRLRSRVRRHGHADW